MAALHRGMMLEDQRGRKMAALEIFSMTIKYLRDQMMSDINKALKNDLEDEDIQWVLTVPAIWTETAKRFMREAAVKGTIKDEQLLIALEPEAASLFCRHLPIDKMVSNDQVSVASFQQGAKYLVLDAGGGTVDITVHQVTDSNSLKEIHAATGGAWGGTRVDEAFRQMMIKLVGGPVYHKFYTDHTDDYLDFLRDFELKKRDVAPDKDTRVTFRIPLSLLTAFRKMTEEDLAESLPQTSFEGKITLSGDKLRVESSVMQDLFRETIDDIVNHLKQLFQEPGVADISSILMVGGFSESAMLQNAVQKNFPDKRVVIPGEAGLAVLNGAVLFGHNPVSVTERVCRFTYGVSMRQRFIQGVHPECKRVGRDDSEFVCRDVFDIFLKKYDIVAVGKTPESRVYSPSGSSATGINLQVYQSTEKSPMFVTDDSCSYVGTLGMDVPADKDNRATSRAVDVRMIYSGTELEVVATYRESGAIIKSTFNLLQEEM